MKYILGPFFKYLGLFIKLFFQTLLAIIITIIWGIPTLFWYIFYFIVMTIWEFKLTFYKLNSFYNKSYNDSLVCDLLWSENSERYKTYFHAIWNINTTINQKLKQKFFKNKNN